MEERKEEEEEEISQHPLLALAHTAGRFCGSQLAAKSKILAFLIRGEVISFLKNKSFPRKHDK